MWLGRKGRKDAFLSIPWPRTDLRSLDDCLVNACHIKEQVSECGWLRADLDLHFRTYKMVGLDSEPACIDNTQRVVRLPCHPS